ncbi:hypothetical protein ACI6Q2_06900 [Chitinophagaceae bacterium LWZ2-11]
MKYTLCLILLLNIFFASAQQEKKDSLLPASFNKVVQQTLNERNKFKNNLSVKQRDSIIGLLNNNTLQFDIYKGSKILYLMQPAQKPVTGTLVIVNTIRSVEYYNIYRILSSCDSIGLINILLPMFNDETRDWYANLLLYDFTGRDATNLLGLSADDWRKKYKAEDVRFWRESQK